MKSLARRHYEKALAAAMAAGANRDAPQTSDQYKLMMAALIEHRRRLHDIQSIERKIDAKREMLPEYDAYVAGVLEAGKGAQDDVLLTIMVWRVDVGDIAGALAIARYALQHGLNPPDQYKRSTAALIAEETADAALRSNIKPVWEKGSIKNPLASDAPAGGASVALLSDVLALTSEHDMHDQIRAKLHKAIGYRLAIAGNYAAALASLTRAIELDDKCGVKKDIERITPLASAS